MSSSVRLGEYNTYPYEWRAVGGAIVEVPLDDFKSTNKRRWWAARPVPNIFDEELTARARIAYNLYDSQRKSRWEWEQRKPLVKSSALRFKIRCFLTKVGII